MRRAPRASNGPNHLGVFSLGRAGLGADVAEGLTFGQFKDLDDRVTAAAARSAGPHRHQPTVARVPRMLIAAAAIQSTVVEALSWPGSGNPKIPGRERLHGEGVAADAARQAQDAARRVLGGAVSSFAAFLACQNQRDAMQVDWTAVASSL